MEKDYTEGKGPGQATNKGRMLIPFLDTPNDHILFCSYKSTAKCADIMRDEVRR
jgi:hypothetical protein